MNSIVRGAAVACLLVLLSAPAHAQVLRQLTDGASGNYSSYAIDDAGDVVFQVDSSDLDGANPDRLFQVIKFTLPGAAPSQVGSFAQGTDLYTVSVTDDGAQVVCISPSDPLGTNHDRSLEVFRMGPDGSGLAQLTNHPAPNAGSVLDAKIAGSGNRVVYLATTDPLGTNPDHQIQLFVVDTLTLAVTQVTTASTGKFAGFSISDDGERVLFAHDGDPIPNSVVDGTPELYTFAVSNSLRKQTTFANYVHDPVLSGNGETIAFTGLGGVKVRGWFDATEVLIGQGGDPSLTDDGAWVYYSGDDMNENSEIWVADTSGVGLPAQLTLTSPPEGHFNPIVSGDNTRVVFRSAYGGPMVMDVDGTNVEELSVVSSSPNREGGYQPVITADGSRIIYQWGRLRRMQTDGSDFFEITTTSVGAVNVTVSADGETIVFQSEFDLTGQNPDTDRQTFKIHSDGTGLVQLSPGDCESLQPSVSADASVFTTFSTCDWTGENPGNDPDLFAVPVGAGAPVQITHEANGSWKIPRISSNGEWVTYMSTVTGRTQVYRARADGTAIEQITFATDGVPWRPDISADGSRVAYASTADPLGTNTDHNREIFVFDASTSTTHQLTFTTSSESSDPVISGDGGHVYFLSDAWFFEIVPDRPLEYYRVAVDTGVVQRVGGLRDPRSILDTANQRFFPVVTVAHDGNMATYSGITNPTGENYDFHGDIWLVDFTTPAMIQPGKAAPTVVVWDVEPSPVRYDVIRGNVANLQTGPADTVDLGPVVCLEDDSPDATTLGSSDPDEPVPGQAFFFLYRGSQGIEDGPGSWGGGTGGAERIAGAGSCTP